ncbi:amidase [Thalassovita mediterranea]|jgi:aspartyl-tRNA(Asn)/glutamyl-tRNA(Gln) amidotransferase subunit A|uniref:Glutamyl-tRNA(Gln) amidotransferase subunit A n=2 Tax=Thalassovita mediterranea TaxID=340021 RepID=A0A0P1GR83_9RHOB|nr:amidase family protein [Thalassovita mediterranea]CUH85136.1 Glutamyl-tRNA(Gln) amidotransferase subunit A [Thalassovita mediterranea]SIS30911.1 aspartyl-tRNA(Asn)/glutamyl-tRNA(Gln) amidotransferase subunit A [Thalassovita mediterranea]
MQEWLKSSAADLGRGIAAGQIDPVPLTQTYLDAIAAHPFADRIYARVTADRALAEAEAAAKRAQAGQRLSPLDGVPISWKDLFDSAGVATEAGSALLKGRVPAQDAPVLANATAQGMVCLGKTHMSELAFSGLGLNPVTATPPCVNDHDAVSGGSSSGAATSVAFDLAACGIGSDTGGSVRIPAAWNDLVGLKTTSGRIPLDGVVELCAQFDTIGPLGRTVEDAALMLAVLEGGKPADLRGATLKGRRFAVLQTVVMEDTRDVPMQAFNTAVEKLAAAGAEIVKIDAPEVAEAMTLTGPLYTGEAYGIWRDVIEAQPDLMFDRILDRFRGGRNVSAADYVAAWRKLHALRARWYQRVAGYDAVLCPTAPILPPNAERLMQDDQYYVTENLLALQNTRVGNLMGNCGVTLPTGTPSCGILLNGLPHQEERLLRIAAAAEAALNAA